MSKFPSTFALKVRRAHREKTAQADRPSSEVRLFGLFGKTQQCMTRARQRDKRSR